MPVINSLRTLSVRQVRMALLSAVFVSLTLAAIGCSKAANTNQTSGSQNAGNSTTSNAANSSTSNAGKGTAEDKGDFKLEFVAVKDEEKHGHLERLVKDSRLISGMVDDMNKDLALPMDIPLVFTECTGLPDTAQTGVENAWYSPDTHQVTMCYELMAKSERLFTDDEKGEAELNEAVVGSTAWTLYHEIGHALIDVYKINLTGKNEDAADQISTLVLLDGTEEGEKAALNGGEDFYREASQDNDLNEMQFADSHSLNKQRFYNVACWVYGTNPEKYAYLTEQFEGMQARANYCQEEYATMAKSWQAILQPFKKS